MTHIWHYKRVTVKRRRQAGLPDLYDWDDLPDPVYDSNYVHVLTEEEQADLHYREFLHGHQRVCSLSLPMFM